MLIFSKKYFLPLLLTLFYVTTTPSAPSTTIPLPKTKFNCKICNQNFTKRYSLNRHEREQHEQSAIQHTCSIFDVTFPRRESLKSHQTTHTSRPKIKFNCEICNKNFTQKGTLKRHVGEQHEQSATQLTCSMCDATFLRHDSLKSHQRTHKKKIPCGNCEKSYFNMRELTRHQKYVCFPTDHHTSPTINLCNTQFVPAREPAQQRSIHKRKRTHSNKSPHPQGKSTDDGSQQPRLKRSKRPQKDLVTIVRGHDRVLPYHKKKSLKESTLDDEIFTGACILCKVKNADK